MFIEAKVDGGAGDNWTTEGVQNKSCTINGHVIVHLQGNAWHKYVLTNYDDVVATDRLSMLICRLKHTNLSQFILGKV